MVREAIQSVFRSLSCKGAVIECRHPLNHGFHEFLSHTLILQQTRTDLVYGIVFLTALGVSLLTLFALWIRSGDPVFAKEAIKLPRFRFANGGYDALSQHEENGNGI